MRYDCFRTIKVVRGTAAQRLLYSDSGTLWLGCDSTLVAALPSSKLMCACRMPNGYGEWTNA